MQSTLPKQEVRRSFALNVLNGAAFQFAERLIDPPLVLTWFVAELTSSNLLRGLVVPLSTAGWFLPQILMSGRLQSMERKMPGYTLTAVIRVVAWSILAATVWLVNEPLVLLVSFFALYTIARLTSGLGGLSFFDVTAKTVPAERRGSLFAWRQFLGGLLGLGAGWIVKQVVNSPTLPFPRDFGLLFGLYVLVTGPAMAAFVAIHEPPGSNRHRPVTLRQQLKRAFQALGADRVYRRHTAARLTLALADLALPFYLIYAKEVLGASDGMLGIYLATRVAAQLASNLLWGRLSDRRGNRLAMQLQSLGNGLTVLLALILVAALNLLRLDGTWLPYLAMPLFALDGAMRPAVVLTGSNFLLELVPEDERPLRLGFSNSLMGIAVLLSGLGGLIVDLLGFASLFGVSLVLCLGGFVLASGLPEPRSGDKRGDA